MQTKIRYVQAGWHTKSDSFRLFAVQFQDTKGKVYEWVPKWEEVNRVFEGAYATEEINNGTDWPPIIMSALQVLIWYTNNLTLQGIKLERKEPKET